MTRTIEAHPTPGLLRWARESAGLSFDEVARETRIEASDLLCNPAPDGARSGVRHDQAQLAQPSRAPALPHHPHSFGRYRHKSLQRNALR